MNIIDNRDKFLISEINAILPQTTFSKMAVGYFYLSGFEAIKPHLGSVQQLRLLIGNSTNQQTAETMMRGYARLEMAERAQEALDLLSRDQVTAIVNEAVVAMQEQLERMPQSDIHENGVKTLADLIAEKRIEIRVFTRGTLHSKAYIFDYKPGFLRDQYGGIAIVGSSNLSYGGLKSNTELNVKVIERDDVQKIATWFDELWKESEPFDRTLLEVVQKSWVKRTLTPYELYLKTLYELVKDRLDDEEQANVLDEMHLPPLMDFQRAAFRRACEILEQYKGVFIADVVGFGKSYIGSAVVKYLRERKRERTLIICPAKLMGMWERYNTLFDLGAKVLSMGMLKYPETVPAGATYSLNEVEALEPYDAVMIDESHNFRNPNTDRYTILQPYLRGRKVILLTATPQNKTVWDYYHQIKLFHQHENTAFPIYTSRLDEFFKACEKRPAQVSQLLDHILIRRRRRDIIETYQPVLNGVAVTFPKRRLNTWTYEIERTYRAGVYDEVVRLIREEMQFARYGLGLYLKQNLSKAVQKKYEGVNKSGTQLRGLIKMLLLKRFESSAQAFVNTVQNMLRAYRVFRNALESGVVIIGRKMDQLVRQMRLNDLEADEETLLDLWQTLSDDYRYDLKDFRQADLLAAVTQDIAALEQLEQLIAPIMTQNADAKRDELVRQIAMLDTQKILIFTEFQDTAAYLEQQLRDAFPNRVIAKASGDDNTVELVRRFAPKSNMREGVLREGEKEIDILIATDALSEGQNMQDAGIIINYDIHWNPVRLIQRIGRVDRIGSASETIQVYNFLPERQLEQQLNLQARVQRRVQEIHDVLGEDDRILTQQEILNDRAMYAIAQGDDSVFDDSEPRTPLQEAERVMRELQRTNPTLLDRIKTLPDASRGTLPPSQVGKTFAFCRAGNYRKLYLHTAQGVMMDDETVLAALRCEPDTPKGVLSTLHNTQVLRLFDDFEREVQIIAAQQENERLLSRAQTYVDQALRVYFTTLTDLKQRRIVEQLRALFTGDIEQYIMKALNRLQRDRVTGAALVAALQAIYTTFNLGVEQADLQRRREIHTALVCSGSI